MNVIISQLVCVCREDIVLIKDQTPFVPRSANILFKDGLDSKAGRDRCTPQHHVQLCSLCIQMITTGYCLTYILMGTGKLLPAKLLLRSFSVHMPAFTEADLNKTGDSLLQRNLTSRVCPPSWQHNIFGKKTEGRKILLKLYSA